MFHRHTDWLEHQCFYAVAVNGARYVPLAGPYATSAEAERVLPLIKQWAVVKSGDPDARSYKYMVLPTNNGHMGSLLCRIGAGQSASLEEKPHDH
jgi:hypothetical protein